MSTAVLRALEGEVANRYSTAREFSTALRAGASGRQPPVPSSDAPTRVIGERDGRDPGRWPTRRRPWPPSGRSGASPRSAR